MKKIISIFLICIIIYFSLFNLCYAAQENSIENTVNNIENQNIIQEDNKVIENIISENSIINNTVNDTAVNSIENNTINNNNVVEEDNIVSEPVLMEPKIMLKSAPKILTSVPMTEAVTEDKNNQNVVEQEIIEDKEEPGVKYSSHIENIGWQSWKTDGAISGTTGKAYRIEALKIELVGIPSGSITYQTHVENVGWQNWTDEGKIAGTEGKGLRVEALRIKLNNVSDYSIAYRAHVENIGWQEWKTDGDLAGTEGKGLRIEAIQIKIIPKKSAQITYQAHVENIGWQNAVQESKTAGTTGKGLQMEALKINLINAGNASLTYQAHVENIGWQNWVNTGKEIGTTGKGLQIEALRIKISNLSNYTVYYRAHVENIGWQEWKKDGEMAGTTGKGLHIEAIEIKLVYKENSSLSTTTLKGIDVSHHNGDINWQAVKNSGIQFAIIRLGYGEDLTSQDDKKFEYNVSQCIKYGIPYGVYLYSYAINENDAVSEANHALRLLKGKNPKLGVWFDMEDADNYKANRNVTNETCIQICDKFCSILQSKGYSVGIYASCYWLEYKINDSRLDKYDKWVAQWSDKCTYKQDYSMWQYADDGIVDGISGRVDMDYLYIKK